MRFALLDEKMNEFHEGVTLSQKEPAIITWAKRGFIRKDSRMDGATGQKVVRYIEAETHRIA